MLCVVQRFRRWYLCAFGGILLCLPITAFAHERFVKHTPKAKLNEDFFLSLNGDMLNIVARVGCIMTAMLFLWFMREPLYAFLMHKILKNVRGKPREIVEMLCAFAMDKPIAHPWYISLGQWTVVFFLRCPALVLMFAAANNSLVMPSYPLEPSTLMLFQFAQVIMAIGILTQSFLPLGGATIFGTFIYMLTAYDWKIAVDVLPVLTVAVIYVSSPWDSWKRVITTVNVNQMRWVRILLGFGFFALGWMKLYNYYLTVGVADNYPAVLNDPMIKLFYFGTDPSLQRECWIVAFGMAEVLTGFLVMVGVFSRVWCAMMIYLFTKLMIVDFGWNEIPHLYPIGAFLLVTLSNNLSNEFGKVDDRAEAVARTGKCVSTHLILSFLLAMVLSVLAMYPMLYLLTRVAHPKFF